MAEDKSSKVPIAIIQTDLVGDCVRLNQRFELDEDQLSANRADLADIHVQLTDIINRLNGIQPGGTGTPVTSATVATPTPLAAPAISNLIVSTSYADVPGMSLSLTKAGWWRIDVTVAISMLNTDSYLDVIVVAGSTTLPGIIQASTSVGGSGQMLVETRPWLFHSTTGAELVKVQAKKISGTGLSQVQGSSSSAGQISRSSRNGLARNGKRGGQGKNGGKVRVMAMAMATPENIRPADIVELRLGVDWPVMTAAYCRWRADGLFPQIFHLHPDWTLPEFLDWNYQPSVEPVGCYVGEALVGVGWICQAYRIDGRTVAEVGAAFFKGIPLSIWHRSLDLLLYHAFVDRDFDEVYGLSSANNRAARLIANRCGMKQVESVPWLQEIDNGTVIVKLSRRDWSAI